MAMKEEQINQTNWVDALDQKLFKVFPGRVVRKDLVKRFKVGDNIQAAHCNGFRGKTGNDSNCKSKRLRHPAR
jgi:hypothetical protein